MLSVHDGKVTHINHPDADDDIVNVFIEKGSRAIVKQSESICPVKAIKVLE
jgi:ferredoxin